ncbi:hypothetical protein DL96DRAFT_1818972 [Flagelloscypha sp. PMI_526]|nr:hypothetical protein DL96DRAFT_1818972 [Flagelloscypha sp. PMI_526]
MEMRQKSTTAPFTASPSQVEGHPSSSSYEDSKFFGIPRYQPFTGGRSFDYEHKYPPDPLGEEARDEARVWATYLDEAESYDHDMIQGFRDTIDSLLVLAGLFSAVVATFVIQTSQSLKPDYAKLGVFLQLEQVALLRTGGNVSAMAAIPSSRTTVEISTYKLADLWVNGLFFTSLSLSMATALLGVLVKQWCQAYTSVTSGSSRDKALTRQFRFDGLQKWKLQEIVGSLPLLLHLAFVVFFAGLACFVYDLHPTLSSTVIIIMILSLSSYLGTLILPALWLDCPYRIPLLFRPSRFIVYLFAILRRYFGYEALPMSLRDHLPRAWQRTELLTSLKRAEETLLRIPRNSSPVFVTARSFRWLFTLSKNKTTQRIVAQALYGYLRDRWIEYDAKGNYICLGATISLKQFLELIPVSSFATLALDSVVPVKGRSHSHPLAPFKGLLDVLIYLHTAFNIECYIPHRMVNRRFLEHIRQRQGDEDLRGSLLRWGADINFGGGSPLRRAAYSRDTKLMKWLLQNGARVDDYESEQFATELTTLMTECSRGHLEEANILIEAGADVNLILPDRNGVFQSPLSLTVSWEATPNLELIASLLHGGARVNQGLHNKHDTVLYRAAQWIHVDAVRFLLEHGADVTAHQWCIYPQQIRWADLVIDDENAKSEIEGLLRNHASQQRVSYCLSSSRYPTVLSRFYLAY